MLKIIYQVRIEMEDHDAQTSVLTYEFDEMDEALECVKYLNEHKFDSHPCSVNPFSGYCEEEQKGLTVKCDTDDFGNMFSFSVTEDFDIAMLGVRIVPKVLSPDKQYWAYGAYTNN